MASLRAPGPTAALAAAALLLSPLTGCGRRMDDEAHAVARAAAAPLLVARSLPESLSETGATRGAHAAAADQRAAAGQRSRFPHGKHLSQVTPLVLATARPDGLLAPALEAARLGPALPTVRAGSARPTAGVGLQAVRWDDEDSSDGDASDRKALKEDALSDVMRTFEDQYYQYTVDRPRAGRDLRQELDDLSETELEELAATMARELDLGEDPRSISQWPMFWAEMEAVDDHGKSSWVNLPSDIAGLLVAGQLKKTTWGADTMFVAPCARDTSRHLAVKVSSREQHAAASNEIRMMQRVRSSGNVLALLGSKEFPWKAFMLTEAPDFPLEHLLEPNVSMPLAQSLPILVDLLRGARDLSDAGIVHGSITADKVWMEKGRPLLSGFDTAAFVGGSDTRFGRAGIRDHPGYTHRYEFPPETIYGTPTAPSNNVWQVGLLFARMCLCFNPVERGALEAHPQLLQLRGDPAFVDRIQAFTRFQWSPARDPGIQGLEDEDARRLLEGLLDPSVERRWDAVGALAEAVDILERRGLVVPEEREPVEPVDDAPGDWQ